MPAMDSSTLYSRAAYHHSAEERRRAPQQLRADLTKMAAAARNRHQMHHTQVLGVGRTLTNAMM